MSWGEKKLVLLTGLAIAAATTIPLLYGALSSPPGETFLWGVGFLPDTLGKLSFVSQAAAGSLVFIDTYTSEQHPPAFFHPLFLVLGWVARLTGLFPPLVLQLNRILFVLLLVAAVYALCRRFFADRDERSAAFFLVLLSGGPGFLCLIHPFFHASADVRGAEMTTFFSMYQQGHFAAALFFMVVSAVLLIRSAETGSLVSAAGAGASFLALASVHPYDVPVMAAAGTAYMGARLLLAPVPERPSRAAGLALFLLIPAPLAGYHAFVAAFAPVFSEFSREGLLAPPWPFFDYLLGYSPLLALAALGFASAYRRRRAEWLFPAAWIVLVPLLMLTPFPARRKLMEGYHLFLCLPAALGLAALRPLLGRSWKPVTAAVIAALSGSSLYVMARDAYCLDLSRSPVRSGVRVEAGALVFENSRPVDRLFAGSPWIAGILARDLDRYYVEDDLVRAIKWMRSEIPADSAVLASPSTGMIVPMLIARRVFAGHIFETLRYREKTAMIGAFMDPALPDEARKMFLEDNGVGTVLWDSSLASAGKWRPHGRSWLAKRAAFGGVSVFTAGAGGRPAVPDAARDRLKIRIDACLLKAQGREFHRAGLCWEAARAFRLSLQLWPGDPEAEKLLYEALRRVSPPRPPAESRGTG